MSETARQEPSAFSQALPIVLGYLPVGFAYGVLAVKAGLSVANTGSCPCWCSRDRRSSSEWT